LQLPHNKEEPIPNCERIVYRGVMAIANKFSVIPKKLKETEK